MQTTARPSSPSCCNTCVKTIATAKEWRPCLVLLSLASDGALCLCSADPAVALRKPQSQSRVAPSYAPCTLFGSAVGPYKACVECLACSTPFLGFLESQDASD